MTDFETRKTYMTAPGKAARETDYYRVQAEELDPHEVPPLLFETLLSDVEAWGKEGIDELLTGTNYVDPELASRFAWFLAFQLTRGESQRREMRYMANELFKLSFGNLTDAGIEALLAKERY